MIYKGQKYILGSPSTCYQCDIIIVILLFIIIIIIVNLWVFIGQNNDIERPLSTVVQ